jgi:hypothetical protein
MPKPTIEDYEKVVRELLLKWKAWRERGVRMKESDWHDARVLLSRHDLTRND